MATNKALYKKIRVFIHKSNVNARMKLFKGPARDCAGPTAPLTFVTNGKDLDLKLVDRSINAHTPEV